MRQFLNRFNAALDRVLGLVGGVVCAFVASLAAFYVCGVLHCHIMWFIGAAVFSLLLFSALGLVLHRYFACFFVPVFNGFANSGDGGDFSSDTSSARVWFCMMCLMVSLLALFIGALFQIHISFAAGAALFVGYALLAPRVFSEKVKDTHEHTP